MSDCPTCTNPNLGLVTALENEDVCPTVVSEDVCVQATVTVTPSVVTGEIKSFCLGNPIIGKCPGQLQRFCSFMVSQKICVQVPLTFSATAAAEPNGIVCGTPKAGECADGKSCTHTIGFFKTHPEITNALITAAGGSITLGTGDGLSFIVDTTNANDVLSLDTPAPPAPDSPPLANQYQVLYAQLLAAKLNVLSITALGVEVCDFAASAIIAADEFLDESPDGGKDGAPKVQEPLALFNEGKAPGCPFHCSE